MALCFAESVIEVLYVDLPCLRVLLKKDRVESVRWQVNYQRGKMDRKLLLATPPCNTAARDCFGMMHLSR
jgi:hypothetical protein